MSITLGLNTALSGLLANQRALDTISQNVVNVNTPGYTRKTLNLESVVLAGTGSGVQSGTITRNIDEGLLKDIRRQGSTLGYLDTMAEFNPRIQDLFGEVADDSSISHSLESLFEGFEILATEVNKPAQQWSTVQAAIDTTNKLQTMTEQLQALRLEADRSIEEVVTKVNSLLTDLGDLNQKIVRGEATGSGTADLRDKRDTVMNDLAQYVDIQYYERNDGSMLVYTSTGQNLVGNVVAELSHAATTITASNLTLAGGNFNDLTIDGGTTDISSQISDGQLRALLNLRDTVLPNLQANLDEMALKLKDTINQVHNRGTIAPALTTSMTGTRTFAIQDNISATATSQQKIMLGSGDDVVVALFDASGTQQFQTTLRTLMQADYSSYAGTPGTGRDATDFDAMTSDGPWTVNQVSAHLQSWMQAQGLTNASVNLDSDHHMAVSLGSTSSPYSLAFRDQVSGTAGATAEDVAISFDVDGDGEYDQSVSGFSNFFGFNDFFVTGTDRAIQDSEVKDGSYSTSTQRTFRLYDETGLLGSTITLAADSTLSEIATAINDATQTNESAALSSSTIGATASLTLTFADSNGDVSGYSAVTVANGSTTLASIAAAVNAVGGTVQASVVQDGANYRLRFWDTRGVTLSTTISGTIGGSSASTILDVQETHRVNAVVIPEGSGYRLRITQTENAELFIAADQDAQNKSILTDLNLHHAATTTASSITLRTDIQSAPERISRGVVRYNEDIAEYYLSEGDNTTALALGDAMTSKVTMATAGNIYAGSYTFSQYAASSISVVSSQASFDQDRLDYQQTLTQSLAFQNTSKSGVNLDEEVANMINFQQAYSAAARVIAALQEMLDVLVNTVK